MLYFFFEGLIIEIKAIFFNFIYFHMYILINIINIKLIGYISILLKTSLTSKGQEMI
jgi:hypothetical protein